MKTHLRSIAKKKVSDFLLREEGMVGNRSAFATAALVSTTALAMTLLVAPDAKAALVWIAPIHGVVVGMATITIFAGRWVRSLAISAGSSNLERSRQIRGFPPNLLALKR